LFADQNVSDPRVAEHLMRTPPARLIAEKEFTPESPFFRYLLNGEPRSDIEAAQLREQLKNIHDQPYLPGSTLKGALRTAIGWYAWEKLGLAPDRNDLYRDDGRLLPAKFVGQAYEHQIFVQPDTRKVKEPNYDMLKSLQVADSAPRPSDSLMVANTQVLLQDGSLGSPVEVEAIRDGIDFETTIKMDWVLFSSWAEERGLRLPGRQWLESLPDVANAHARQQITAELNWFKNINGAKRIVDFYQQLQNASLPPNTFFLQVGWATGWNNTTFGSRLQADEDFMEAIIGEYKLSIGGHEYGDPFPTSRHVLIKMRTNQQTNREVISLVAPIGWMLVEMVKGTEWM
jgi:CRISPR-associated protein Csm5